MVKMMKLYKNAAGIAISMLMLCIVAAPVSAKASSSYTYDEVVLRIESILQKYEASTYNIGDCTEVIFLQYTKEEIDEQLMEFEQAVIDYSSMTTYYSDSRLEATGIIEAFATHENMVAYNNITQGLVSVQIELSATVTWDRLPAAVGGQSFISNVSNISSRKYGTHLGTATWTQTGSGWSLEGDQPSRIADIWANGTLDTTIIIVGIPVSSTYDYTIGMKVQVPV